MMKHWSADATPENRIWISPCFFTHLENYTNKNPNKECYAKCSKQRRTTITGASATLYSASL